ncbi:copper resistance protein B [Lysobacter niastensis]|uniref:Copper resistance protein B n=1 Tax=Lysobacter niastensis TaxID=380629 RepID=A0ABS0BCC1_9GAMM|nr:copper resistance protein B [Lysobacter niastensis]MBF6025416.1 copper resistance protein B [Lysobacter niastensis]
MTGRHSTPFGGLAFAIILSLTGNAHAQDHSHHGATQPPAQQEDQHSSHQQQGAEESNDAEAPKPIDHGSMDHGAMDHSAMGHDMPSPAEPKTPVPPVTDADRAAAFPPLQHHMQHAKELNTYVAFNRLEAWDADHGSGQAWEAQGWIGSDLNRLWLRSEGERVDSHTEAANLEAFYGRSVSPWWDVVAGVRHDFKPGASRDWLAVGVQGLAPYKFEVQATAYLGESGHSALNLEAEYELLLTSRLILQPLIEADFYGKDDPQRGIGSGLASVEAGLRLRYEVTRRFAPYIGIVHERSFGDTADFRREEGEDARDTRVVAGVRVWF